MHIIVGIKNGEAETAVVLDDGELDCLEEDERYNIDEKLKYVR
jgi:hypothetical protein